MDPNERPDLLEIDRESFRPEAHSDRFESVKTALSGLWFVLRTEQSFRLLLAYTVVILGALIWLDVPVVGAALVVFSVGVQWVTECLNTAIEATVDLVTPEYHPMAKVAKDVASTAAFFSSLMSIIVSVMIMGPPLVARLSG